MDNWWDDVEKPGLEDKLPRYYKTIRPLSVKIRDCISGYEESLGMDKRLEEWADEAQRLEDNLNGIQNSLGLMIDLAMTLKRRLK